SLTLVPLVTLWSTAVSPALKAGGRASTDGRATRRFRSVLIAGEIAAALALLAGSALMIQSSMRMLRVDPGFRVDGILTASVGLRPRAYPDAVSRADYYGRLLRRLEERAGVGSIALSDAWPLQSVHPTRVETVGDRTTIAQAGVSGVTSGYFATLGMTFREGAAFTAEDRPGAEPVVVVSESLARRLWPGARAVGQRLRIHAPDGDDTNTSTSHRVVGVVKDVRLVDYDDGQVRADADRLNAYVPLLREPGRFVFLYMKDFPASPETLRLTVAELDREAAVGAPASLAAAYAEARSAPRQLAWVLSVFAAFAAMLALLGVYSIIAYSVRQRQREIGIRLVIGAEPRTVIIGFVQEGAPLVAVGLLAGLAGAAGIGQVLRSQLFGVRTVEPSILAATTVLFALCGSLALWWPARRAALVNPTQVLRDD
ncbi:MAG: ABC transporter permease, partial [Burkholderiales bacterium]